MYEDIYFLNRDEALRVASEQNRWGSGVTKFNLQCCYYDGEKIESDLVNLFHLPIDYLLEDLVYGSNRIPSKIDFSGLDISRSVQLEILTFFNMTMEDAKQYRKELHLKHVKELKNAKLDFSEPLRFYLITSSQTTVMQFISKSIANTLQNRGYEVLYDIYHGVEDGSSFKKIYEFNPHATININHINNQLLSDDVFNFIWFQDEMSVLTDNKNINLRQRDYVFYLIRSLADLLKKKGVNSSFQPFCMDNIIYKARKDIKKEKKIVFIGSSYSPRIKEIKHDHDFNEIFSEALKIFEEKSYFKSLEHKDSDVEYLMKKYNKTEKYINNIYGYLLRDYCVEKLCSIKTNYEVEIYGYHWENNEKVRPYFKGIVKSGKEISKIYNSAIYGYCPGGYVLMQRTLECAFSETIPLVLDSREDREDSYDEIIEEGIEFFHIKDLEHILANGTPKVKNYEYIKEQYSYEHLIQKYLNIINENIQKQ